MDKDSTNFETCTAPDELFSLTPVKNKKTNPARMRLEHSKSKVLLISFFSCVIIISAKIRINCGQTNLYF